MHATHTKRKPRAQAARHSSLIGHNYFDLYNNLEEIKTTLAKISNSVTDKASDVISYSIDAAKDSSAQAKKNVNRYVTKKPYRVIGMVAVSCLLLGLFMRR